MAGSTRKLLIIFAALLVVTIAWNWLERRRITSRERTFGKVDTEEVTRIDISGKGNSVELSLQGGMWLITSPLEYPAGQATVEDMLGKVDELAVVNLISSNPENHDLYEVGADTGVLVTLSGGREGQRRLLSFYIGKMTSDFGHTYIRRFGEDDVYSAKGLLSGYFNKPLSSWRDRTILSLTRSDVTQITLVSQEDNWTLLRGGSLLQAPDYPWILQIGEERVEADSSSAESVVRTVSSVNASSFPEPGEEVTADWENPVFQVEVELIDGSSAGIAAFEKEDDTSRFWIRKRGDDTIFLIYKSNIDYLLKARKDMLKEGEGEGEPGLY